MGGANIAVFTGVLLKVKAFGNKMPLSLISRFRETVLVCGKFIGITVMFVSLKTCATCQTLTMKPLRNFD